jgi:hypothetical protein
MLSFELLKPVSNNRYLFFVAPTRITAHPSRAQLEPVKGEPRVVKLYIPCFHVCNHINNNTYILDIEISSIFHYHSSSESESECPLLVPSNF